jgi:sarcosine oxidase
MAMSADTSPRVVVIGAGINGLCTAYHLLRLGCRNVTVIERFALGHDRGSSHGAVRITRSTYADPLYVRLMAQLHSEEWPRLAQDFGEQLVLPAPGCFFGPPDGPFETYAHAVASVGADVERLTPAEGRRRFPRFHFAESVGVLDDHTAGVLRADATLTGLSRWIATHGAVVQTETAVLDLRAGADDITVVTDRGPLTADVVVVTAGAWLGQLVPSLARKVTIQRQTVGYYELAPTDAAEPVWVYLGRGPSDVYYGLPDSRQAAVKVGRHETSGRDDDPDEPAEPEAEMLSAIEQVLAEQLSQPVIARKAAETCLYTSTPSEDFLVGPLPAEPRILIGSACSGHGFKLGPLTGRLLAEMALGQPTSGELWDAARQQFSVPATTTPAAAAGAP